MNKKEKNYCNRRYLHFEYTSSVSFHERKYLDKLFNKIDLSIIPREYNEKIRIDIAYLNPQFERNFKKDKFMI